MQGRDERRAAYRLIAEQRPDLFTNPEENGIQILLDDKGMDEAEATIAERLAKRSLPPEWAHIGVAFQDQYQLLLRDAVRFPDGTLGTYVRTIPPATSTPGVVILPLWNGHVLLERQFRHATRSWHLEIPRGFGEAGQTGEENARRELLEEINGTISRIVPLGISYPDTGMGAGFVEFFYADVEAYGSGASAEAISEILAVSLSEFERMIRDQEICDGFTLCAYARAKTRGLI